MAAASPSSAWAHSAGEHAAEAGVGWHFDLPIMINLALVGGLYAAGLAAIWRRSGAGKVIRWWQAAAFAGGIATCVAALLSPIVGYSARLSWVHMIQHMLLMNVAAPLLVLGSPALVLLWALPLNRRRHWGRWLQRTGAWQAPYYPFWQPLLVWSLFAFTLWIWHLPSLYQAALRNDLVHDFQHLAFLLAACLFWRVLLDPFSRLRLSRGTGVFYLFTTSLHATVLGVFMALSPRVWYPDYEPLTGAYNLSALEDQQIAGLIMWMPACMVYALAAAVMFAFWLRECARPTVAERSAG